MSGEKRGAFRIAEAIRLSIDEISDEEWNSRLDLLAGSTSTSENIQSAVEDLNLKISQKLIAVHRVSATIAGALELYNSKLDLVIEHLAQQQSQRADLGPATVRSCELSATGVNFPSSRQLSKGQKLYLRLSLVTDGFYFESLAKVIRCEPIENNTENLIAVEFHGLRDQDKDRLIKHLLNRQSESIRAKRMNVEAYEQSLEAGEIS
ncbi:MAG: PilZ domain-containing protein [Pseudomonadota bacterium]